MSKTYGLYLYKRGGDGDWIAGGPDCVGYYGDRDEQWLVQEAKRCSLEGIKGSKIGLVEIRVHNDDWYTPVCDIMWSLYIKREWEEKIKFRDFSINDLAFNYRNSVVAYEVYEQQFQGLSRNDAIEAAFEKISNDIEKIKAVYEDAKRKRGRREI